MITNSGKVFNPAASDQYDRVFLQIMTLAWNISVDFFLVGKPYPGYLPHS